jgi:hypothetical protein
LSVVCPTGCGLCSLLFSKFHQAEPEGQLLHARGAWGGDQAAWLSWVTSLGQPCTFGTLTSLS